MNSLSQAAAPIDHGGGEIATMMAMSARQLRDRYLATGLATSDDIERYLAFAADPSCSATYHGVVRGSARMPLPRRGPSGRRLDDGGHRGIWYKESS